VATVSGKVTIDLKAAAPAIAQSVIGVLEARGVNLCRLMGSYADIMCGQELEDLYSEIGKTTAACLGALEEVPEPAPGECRHSDRLIRLDGTRKCRDCDTELEPVPSPVFTGPKRVPLSEADARRPRGRR
jgi:hypothetical protein